MKYDWKSLLWEVRPSEHGLDNDWVAFAFKFSSVKALVGEFEDIWMGAEIVDELDDPGLRDQRRI